MDTSTSAEKEWLKKLQMGKTDPTSSEGGRRQPGAKVTVGTAISPLAGKPKRGFDDIAGMEELKTFVTEAFINVLNNRECAKAYGIVPPSILLYGAPGTGKTYFAQALASEVGANFIAVAPDDVASKYVHGTQEKIGEIFRKAERHAPSILFLDELDALIPQRTEGDIHNQNGEVNEFLCMMNNASERGIYIVAASNHPENIDKAALRTGRIDEVIYVGMPDHASRKSLFRLSLSKLPAAEDIDYDKLADLTAGYNCSDISYIVKMASRKMFNESIAQKDEPYKLIGQIQLEDAIKHQSPSVSQRELQRYERVRNEFSPKDAGVVCTRIGFH